MSAPLAPVERLAARRGETNERFFTAVAERTAGLCHRIAERFARGGKLVALAASPQGRSDARHVAVEFVHPVIVGKRALPALALCAEGGDLATQARLACEPDDVAIGFDAGARAALALARERGCLTIAYEPLGAEVELVPRDADPFVRQELAETHYHVLWELCHVFFEHRGLLAGRSAGSVHDAGASSFLYPFLAEAEHDLDAVVDDVRGSVLAKADEIGRLRERTVADGGATLRTAARELRARLDAGGKLLALGNGGSATDAMDAVADFRAAPQGWPARRALDLTEDAAILTAVANDVGVEEMFQRQVIAHASERDALLALSTSGGSGNVVEALAEARRRGLLTIALVGYDGGRIAADALADHVVVVPSEHIPRIQEAQATAYHLLRELVEEEGA